MLPRPDFVEAEELLDSAFVKLRAEADAWQAARTAFMTGRLKEGRHPDTDRDFWDGYTERPAPGLPAISVPEHYNARLEIRHKWLSLLTIIGIPTLVVVVLVIRKVRMRRRKVKRKDEMSAEFL